MNPDKKIRRLQSLLYTSGAGTILFSLWSGIRGMGAFFEGLNEISGHDNEVSEVILGISFFIVLFCFLSFYIYIGKKAIDASLGKCKGNAYIVMALISVVISLAAHISDFISSQSLEWTNIEDMILFVIDFTSNVILVEVVVFSILLRKWRD